MTTIVFNPDWNAPETVVKENILPPLQRKSYSILKTHKLYVSYNGKPVDPTKVDWNRVNGLAYTFSQKAGPHNNLGKVKFLYPNRHTVYMHDTLPVRKKYFKQTMRTIGHECVRMEKPDRFAEVLLAESNGWTARPGQGIVGQGRQQLGRARAEDPGAYGLFHGGGGRERQGRDLRRRLRARPQAGRRAVRRCHGISAAAAGKQAAASSGRPTRRRPRRGARRPTTTWRGRCKASSANSAAARGPCQSRHRWRSRASGTCRVSEWRRCRSGRPNSASNPHHRLAPESGGPFGLQTAKRLLTPYSAASRSGRNLAFSSG